MFQRRTTKAFLLAAAIFAGVVAWTLMVSVESQKHVHRSTTPQTEAAPSDSETAGGSHLAPPDASGELELSTEAQDLLDAIAPEKTQRFGSGSVRYIRLKGGDIGTVDAQGLVDKNPESLIYLLDSLSEVTGAFDGLEIRIRRASLTSDGGTAIYNQFINGIRVSSNQSVDFDAEGTVTDLSSLIAGPGAVIYEPVIPEGQATRFAVSKLTQELGFEPSNIVFDQGGENLEAKHPYIGYQYSSDGSSLTPYWTISLVSRSDSVDRVAMVNAVSGETKLFSE